jgi:glutamate/tyrosine decarboxylase-like PLP-dependent enzyme
MATMAEEVSRIVVDHLAGIRQQPAHRSRGRAELDAALLRGAPDAGTDFSSLMAELQREVFPYHAREPHPRFIGYVPSCPTFPGVMGDWLATGYNFFAGVWSVAAGPNELELVVLDWFRTWLGMSEGARGILTSGGSTASLTAIVAARHAAVGDRAELLPGLTVYTSEQAHSSVARAAWIAGIPRANVRAVPVDDRYRMRADALADAIAEDRRNGRTPVAVVGSAGTTNTGAVDPLEEIADLCAREGIWMHVDAAYAGFTALLPEGRAALKGIERADSVTLDPHKWLFVPFECGCLLVRDPKSLEHAFSVHPEYLTDVRAGHQEVNFADSGEQLTRYSRALKIWLSVRYFGLDAIRDAIARGVHLAEYAQRRLETHGAFEILSPARYGVLCFRLHDPSMPGDALDAFNERVNATVNATGHFLYSSTRLGGRYSMRICTHGFRTTEGDVDALIDAIAETATSLRAAR